MNTIIKMEKHLLNILKETNTIIIPRLGALTITNDATGEIMFMPYLKYDDGKLAELISKAENISTEEAKSNIDQSVQAILNELEDNKPFSINGVGTFSKGEDDIEFKYNETAVGGNTSPKTESPAPKVEEAKIEETTPPVIEETAQTEEVDKPTTTPVEEVKPETKVEKEEPEQETVKTEDKKDDKLALKAKQTADKEAKEKIKAEKAAKALADKEAKAKEKSDKKNKKSPEGKEGDAKPKKKKGFLFWLIIIILLGAIAGGAYFFINKGHHDEKGHGTDHKENTEHDASETHEGDSMSTEHEEGDSNHEHSSSNAQSGSFYIILGSFIEKVNAEGLAERMVMEGHSHASVIERNGNYSVVFNKYSSKDEAKAELQEARTIAKNAWVFTAE